MDGEGEMLRGRDKEETVTLLKAVSASGSGVGFEDGIGDEGEGINWLRPARSH